MNFSPVDPQNENKGSTSGRRKMKPHENINLHERMKNTKNSNCIVLHNLSPMSKDASLQEVLHELKSLG